MPRPDGTTVEGDGEVDQTDIQDQTPDTLFEDVGDVSQDDEGADTLSTDAAVTEENRNLKAKNKELESRIGSLVKANDDRLKEKDAEWQAWGENYRIWAIAQIEEAEKRGREEAEEKFLPLMSPEEEASYYRGVRETEKQRKAEAAKKAKDEAAQRRQVGSAVQTAIDSAIARGVPREALDVSSPEAVMDSAVNYLAGQKSKTEAPDDVAELKRQLDETREEVNRLKRDTSGASRTTVGGGTPPIRQSDQAKAVATLNAEIDKAKRRHNIAEVMRLKRELARLVPS